MNSDLQVLSDNAPAPARPVSPGDDRFTYTLTGDAFLNRLLAEQQTLTAVDVFSIDHDADAIPAQAKYYSRLIPSARPEPGQQYAFEVDLDRCSGCKACVTGCHSMNGLDDSETWRDVGLLVGGTEQLPVLQHVTAACHHCLEPACMIACPVNAYEKDPETGIVKHLDDQCFGCQYCTLACPYNVPKYHAAKGIVRKCDMCSSRLAVGEAPACVQACPHEAIAIRIVSIDHVRDDSEANAFLPAAPDPCLTLPTTTYKSSRVFPRNTLPADYHALAPEHPHWPLIVMLVLTQLSVGAFMTGQLLERYLPVHVADSVRPYQATAALVLGLIALVASVGHLGRPLLAFRGVLGFRHSWLSREIAAFGLFATLAIPYAALCWGPTKAVDPRITSTLGSLVSAAGLIGVFCSAMIYVFTRRELWSFERTMLRFLLTSWLLGAVTTWVLVLLLQHFVGDEALRGSLQSAVMRLSRVVVAAGSAKLIFDLLILRALADHRLTSLKRTAKLICGVLSPIATARVGLGILGGVVLPLLAFHVMASADGGSVAVFATAIPAWAACVGGELLERYLFFAASAAPRMPGAIRT